MIYDTMIDGLPLRTGDVLCTSDGSKDGVLGRLWYALGHLVPGEIDHVVLYLGPGGRYVEAGAKGVIAFEMAGPRWKPGRTLGARWLMDTLVGAAYPLAGRGLPAEEEERIRSAVARYCLEQAGKPYNFNFFDTHTDAAFYCSQLIYKAYLSAGVDLSKGSERADTRNGSTLVLPQLIWQNCPHRRPDPALPPVAVAEVALGAAQAVLLAQREGPFAPQPDLPPNAVHPLSRSAWRTWLEQHHTRAEGIWLVSYKKGTGKPSFTYDEAVEEALCFGWVDSKGNKLDAERSMLWFAPRRPGSGWSKPNKERVERLIAAGLMAPAGLAKIAAAKTDGSWEKLDAVEALEVPPDLAEALAAHPDAERHFAAFPRSAKRGILEWISSAKKPATRAKRVAETARLAQENKRANQWR